MNDPAWLTTLVDQRMALLEHKVDAELLDGRTLLTTPLTEPAEDATMAEYRRWDRTCDGCGKYIPPPLPFYSGQLLRTLKSGYPVYLMFGVCHDCNWYTDPQ
jgi:hypothetical protein